MTNIEALIFDLDRTLLRTDRSLSEYTITTLKKCKDLGFKIFVASGRPFRNIECYNDLINYDAVVASNGGRIINKKSVIENPVSFDSSFKFLKLLEDYPYFKIIFETGDVAYSNVEVDFFDAIVCDNLKKILENNKILKIVIEIHDDNSVDIIKKYLNDDVYCTIANGYVVQIMSNKATKFDGVKSVLETYNIKFANCIYFGDDYDDIKSISKCGVGVAMGNAIKECKEVSDYICKTNDEDGVANFINEFLFKE